MDQIVNILTIPTELRTDEQKEELRKLDEKIRKENERIREYDLEIEEAKKV